MKRPASSSTSVRYSAAYPTGAERRLAQGALGQPGFAVADAVGAASGGILWWVIMILNSLVWGAVLSLFVFPFIRKILK